MTFYYEELDEEAYRAKFKTLRGALTHAASRIPEARYGYLHANKYVGARYPRHIVAEWKRAGVVVAQVWT